MNGELRWRDAMRPRLRPRCKIAPISVALDETPTLDESLPPDHFLKTGSFAGNLDLCTCHWIQCDTDFKCVQRNLPFHLFLSWAACSNISSLDYSWPVDGTATGNILAFINSLQLILLSFVNNLIDKPTRCPKKVLTECCWSHTAKVQSPEANIPCYFLLGQPITN